MRADDGITLAEALNSGKSTNAHKAHAKPIWISFMVGYGGITVAILCDGDIYYYFTDSNQCGFRKAAVEVNKVHKYYKE